MVKQLFKYLYSEVYCMETKENIKPHIETTPLSQNILENIDLIETILTQFEYSVLWLLEKRQFAYTTKKIRNIGIQESYDRLRRQEKDTISFTENSIYTGKDIENFIKIAEKELDKKIKRKEPTYIWIQSVEKLMSKVLHIRFPSYKKFKSALLSLEKLGLVGRRYDPTIKGKELWFVNPKYLLLKRKTNSNYIVNQHKSLKDK